MMVKKLLNRATHSGLGNQLFSLLEQVERRDNNFVQILTYHRIENVVGFEQQMQHLATNYYVASMVELLEACQGGAPLPPRSVMVTFDDAYRNFAECAWPALQKYQLPVTVFVPTAFPDHPEQVFWWDRLQHALLNTSRRDKIETPTGRFPLSAQAERIAVYKSLREYVKTLPHHQALAWTDDFCRELDAPPFENDVLGWAELRQLATEGVTLGAHTQTHPLLDRVSTEDALIEAIESRKDLERELDSVLPIFAYPNGNFSHEVVEGLRGAGFLLAFTTVRGTNDLEQADPLRLRRNNIGYRATSPVLRARLLHGSFYLNRLHPLAA